ncbi:transposase [Streptomyces olivochromogenes]|nr:transposase [Streptomyces olivochromogenes]
MIEPLPPRVERRAPHRGRNRDPDQLVFQGVLFVLHIGIAWQHLPQELGFGSGMSCWRRLAAWTGAGVRPRLQRADRTSCRPTAATRETVDRPPRHRARLRIRRPTLDRGARVRAPGRRQPTGRGRRGR